MHKNPTDEGWPKPENPLLGIIEQQQRQIEELKARIKDLEGQTKLSDATSRLTCFDGEVMYRTAWSD